MSCLHLNQLTKLVPPAAFSKVYKEECTLCYATTDAEGGLQVCLTCFNGGCTGGGGGSKGEEHANRHYRNTGHALVLNVKRRRRIRGEESHDNFEELRPAKLQKMEVIEEPEPDFDFFHVVQCLACNTIWDSHSPDISAAFPTVNAIVASISAKRRIDVQAWREEAVPCEHTRDIEQEHNPIANKLKCYEKCEQCELKANLWMCLTCGVISCGRKQYDGSGGNGHGVMHFESTNHSAAVKLGTITPEGQADVHCYVCNEMRVDPSLGVHLASFGVEIADMEKTEQTMAELQLEKNLKFDFSMVTDDGRQLEKVHGAGLTGLSNLGNSCYLSSIVQTIFLLPNFRSKYFEAAREHLDECRKDSAACFVCQACKLATGLWSGSYLSISPWMFKAVCTSGHAEFSTPRQQDASEFLAYLFKVVQRSDPVNSKALIEPFTFKQQQKVKCKACGETKYQQIKATQLSLQISDVLSSSNADLTVVDKLHLSQFLERSFDLEEVEAECKNCGGNEKTRQIKLTSLPKYLLMSIGRYVVHNWVPHKIDMNVQVPFSGLDLTRYMTEEVKVKIKEKPIINESVLEELISMGFPREKCLKAITETGNSGIEPAMNWILKDQAGDDDNEDEDMSAFEGDNSEFKAPEEMVQMLIEAGFNRPQALRALLETGGDIERAFDWALSHPLDEDEDDDAFHENTIESGNNNDSTFNDSCLYDLVGFVSHKGPSVHCGHYITHVNHPDMNRWIMFNDEKVVIADPQPPISSAEKAYIYLYKRRE